MRYLPLLLLLVLCSCERDAFVPVTSTVSVDLVAAPNATIPSNTPHPTVLASSWWKELSPAVRQLAGPELSGRAHPVTYRQLQARMVQAANLPASKAPPSACDGFPTPNPEGNVTLNSQADVDAFGAFKCKNIVGAMEIIDTLGPDPITDLTPLSNLKSIGSSLTIDANGLTDLSGLNKLKTIGLLGPFGFIGVNGDGFTDISALSSLKTVTGSINIINCDQLTSITSAFSKLKVIAPGQTPDSVISVFVLNINDNDVLTDISGFSGLTTMDRLMIQTNGALTDLDDLSDLSTIVDDIQIFENAALQNVDELSNITSLGRNLFVLENPSLTSCCGLYGLLCADPPTCTANNVGNIVIVGNNGAGCTEADIVAGGPCL